MFNKSVSETQVYANYKITINRIITISSNLSKLIYSFQHKITLLHLIRLLVKYTLLLQHGMM